MLYRKQTQLIVITTRQQQQQSLLNYHSQPFKERTFICSSDFNLCAAFAFAAAFARRYAEMLQRANSFITTIKIQKCAKSGE